MAEQMTKVCTGCGAEKELAEFHARATGKFGKTSKCKTCKSAQIKDWAERNPQSRRDAVKRYRERHPDRVQKHIKNWKRKNKDHVKDYAKRYRILNPEIIDASEVRRTLRKTNTPLTPENIELAKTRIKLKRIIKQLEK